MRGNDGLGMDRRRPFKASALDSPFRVEGQGYCAKGWPLTPHSNDNSTSRGPPNSPAPPESSGSMRGRWSTAHAEYGAGPCAKSCSEGKPCSGRRPHPKAHLLLASHYEGGSGESDTRTRWTQGHHDDATLHALESRGGCERNTFAGKPKSRLRKWRHCGDGVGQKGLR